MVRKNIPAPRWDPSRRRWVLQIMHNRTRKVFTSTKPKTAGRRECIERAAAWLDSFNTNSNVNFAVAFGRFLADYENKHGAASEQLRKYKLIGRCYLIPAVGELPVSELGIEDYQNIISTAKPQPRKAKSGQTYYLTDHLSKKYLKSIKDCIQAFNSWARPRKYTDLELGAELYVPASAPVKGKEILQIEDVKKLFEHPTGLHYERALWFELLTGLRPGEVLGLQIGDYDPVTGIIQIKRAVNYRGKITPGKNKNAQRALALPPVCREILEKQIIYARSVQSEFIFCNQIGDHGSQEIMAECWRRICEHVGISTNTTPYSLRHSFYTHTEAYLPERMVKMIFGHSEKTDGHSIYGDHEIVGELQAAADRLSITPIYKAASNK